MVVPSAPGPAPAPRGARTSRRPAGGGGRGGAGERRGAAGRRGAVPGLGALGPEAGAAAAAAAVVAAAAGGGLAWELRNCEPARMRPGVATAPAAGRLWTLGVVPIFLATPFFARATFRTEVVPGRVWSFEQKQGIGLGLNTSLNVRMTVVRLRSGGLFVYGPVAPTGECLELVRELGGDVELVLLPTTLYEHKQFLAPFARRFPKAKVLVAPGQYSWPVSPPGAFRAGCPRAEVLRANGEGQLPPDVKAATLDLCPIGLSSRVRFSEVAVLHSASRTLLVTDAVMSLSEDPPPTVSRRDLLEWADDRNTAITGLRALGLFGVAQAARRYGLRGAGERGEAEACALGWQRMALTSLYFGQEDVLRPDRSFQALSARRLVVPPVVGTLVYGDGGRDRVAEEVAEWAERVGRWSFERVAPAHFEVVRASPRDWLSAFAAWRQSSGAGAGPLSALRRAALGEAWAYPEADVQCLRDVRAFLRGVGVIFDDASRPSRRPPPSPPPPPP